MRTICATVCTACLCGSVGAAVIDVPADWPTIQQAINNSAPGDEIVVAPGTYVGSIDTFGNDLTIRSATADASTVTIVGNASFAVYVASFETVTLADLTIENPSAGGRGIFIHNQSSVTLNNCRLHAMEPGDGTYEGALVHLRGKATLAANSSTFENAINLADGGGVGVTDGASATFDGCTFRSLTRAGGGCTKLGGAIHAVGGPLVVMNCTFMDNSVGSGCAGERGGAIYTTADLTVSSCVFQSNSAYQGGAIYEASNANLVTVSDSTFAGNTATDEGGAMWGLRDVVLSNCAFRENSAGDAGGAARLFESYDIGTCAFLCNSATNGGALWLGGSSPPGEVIGNCFFALNDATNGGGIFSNNGSGFGPAISNTIFCGNHVGQIKGGWSDGGGVDINTFCLADPPIDCDKEWPFASYVCPGDIDGSGTVDVDDLVLLIVAWGTADLRADMDRDGSVDVDDLVILLVGWGECEG